MAHHQLGQNEKAQAVLARLRETMKTYPEDKALEAQGLREEAEAFQREAEALLQESANKPKK